MTDDIAEYNHNYLKIVNKHQGESKIFQRVQFWQKYLNKTINAYQKDENMPKVYRTSIRTGRIENRTVPWIVLKHFDKFFNGIKTKIRMSYSSLAGLKIVNLNFYSSNKDLTSLRIIRELQNLFSPLKIGSVYDAYKTLSLE
jgi:hypothetical protein